MDSEMEIQISVQPQNIQKLENIYQGLKIVPLVEVTKKFLEATLKLAGDTWNEIENAFDVVPVPTLGPLLVPSLAHSSI